MKLFGRSKPSGAVVGLALAVATLIQFGVSGPVLAAEPDPTSPPAQTTTPTPNDTSSPAPIPTPSESTTPTPSPSPSALPAPVATDIPGVAPTSATAKSGSDVTPNIVGGEDATIADAPWQVALISATATSEYQGQFCGGSLIAAQWVLTAAHCVVSATNVVSAPSTIKILAGQDTLRTNANNRAVAVSNIYVHPLYVASSDYDDIALIKLSAPLTLVDNQIEKIDLPDFAASPGGPDLITGWGLLLYDTNFAPTVLQKAQVDVLSDASCLDYYAGSFDSKKMLCAGSENLDRDTCQGDSGGPIAYESETWVLEGVTSFGIGCGSGYPGVYTEVYNYKSWINQYITTSPAITGKLTVKDSATATALPKANVFLLPAVDPFCVDYSDPLECATWTVTDASGNYSILPPGEGDYVLAFYPPSTRQANLAFEYFNDKPTYGAADVISFSSTTITGRDALLSPYASIKGKVTYLDGTVTRNAYDIKVCAYATAADAEEGISSGCAYSALDGTYSIDYLQSGSYRLYFEDYDGRYSNVLSKWWSSTGGVGDYSAATPVVIAGGVSALSKNLLLQGPLSVSGKVTYTSGASTPALADAEVNFYDATSDEWVGSTITNSDGTYTYFPESTGSFKIFVDPAQSNEIYSLNLVGEWHVDKPDISQATAVPFSTTSVAGKNVNLSPPATISGRVTYLVGTTVTSAVDVEVCAFASSDAYIECATSNDSGNYAISGLANGSYKLYFDTSNSSATLTSAWLGSTGPVATYASGAAVVIGTSGLSVTGKNVALVVPPNISGKVSYLLSGSPLTTLEGAVVEAYDSAGDFVELITTDSTGNYMFYPPAAGTYYLKFAGDGNLDLAPEWHNDKPDQSVATAIVFGTASIANTNAVLSAPAAISGRVTYPVDGVSTAFAGANVCAYVTADVAPFCATSDETGAYSIEDIPSGSYKLYFDVSQTGTTDAFSAWWGQAANFGATTALTIANGNSLSGKNLALPIPATISGTVTANLTGTLEPLAGIDVTAYDSTYGWVSSTTTDESGRYKLPGLTAGSYKLEFINNAGLNVFGEWFNNADNFSSATAVAVTAAQQLTGKDVELARGAILSGIVTNGGSPLEGADVTITRLSEFGWSEQVGVVATDASGTFLMQGLRAGTYYAQFSAGSSGADVTTAYLGGVRKESNATQIPLLAGQVRTDIDFAMITGGSISGTVVAKDNSSPVQSALVEIYDADGQSVNSAYSDEFGSYSISGVFPEAYSLRASVQGSSLNLADEWWSGFSSPDGADLLTVDSAGQHVANFALESGSVISGFITGNMDDGNGALPVQTTVTVYLKNSASPWNMPQWSASSNESGFFEIGGLQPGTYFVCAGGAESWPLTCAGGSSKIIDSDPVVLGTQTTVSDVNIDLVRGGSISGTITNSATGLAYANGWVYLYREGEGLNSTTSFTDESGAYSFGNLPVGKYFIFVQGGSGPGAVVSEYYNDKYSKATATAITVTSGSEIAANMTVGTTVVGSATVTGKVTNSAGAGLSGIRVWTQCSRANGFDSAYTSTTTAADGTYRLENLTPGSCTLTYDPLSWTPPTSPFNVLGATRTATLVAGTNALTVQALATGGSITGKVTTLAGSPVVMGVAVISLSGSGCVSYASTDASGNYTLGGLPTGSYKVVATNSCLMTFNGGLSGDGLGIESEYPDRWFGGKSTFDTADVVSVTAGVASTGKNIVQAIGIGMGATLSGDVVVSQGESGQTSPARVNVSLQPVGATVGDAYQLSSYSQDNTFSISSIPAGSYNIAVSYSETSNGQSTQPYDYLWLGADGAGAPEVVHLESGQVVSNFRIVMPEIASVSIKLKKPTWWPSQCQSARLWPSGSNYGITAWGGTTPGTVVAKNLQPGTYKLSAECGGSTLWYGGTSKATATEIALEAGQSLSGITWDLGASAETLGAIFGRVTRTVDGRPAGVSRSSVTLFTAAGFPVAETTTGDDGSYVFTGLADGGYKLQFNGNSSADGNITPFTQSEWWNNAASRATSTTVTISGAAHISGIDAVLSDATGKIAAGVPSITGTTRVGQTLTVATGTWTTGTAFSYQWYRGYEDNNQISGATASTYVLQPQDIGKWVFCIVRGEKTGLQASTAKANAARVISGTAMTPGTATITGTAAIGSTLTANRGTWTPASPTFSYQWRRGTVDIPDATSATYVVKPADAGYSISVVVIGSATNYQQAAATSAATATVVAGTLTTATPTISGTPTVGAQLTGATGTWGPGTVEFTYQWLRGTTVVGTEPMYTVVTDDVGKALTFKVTGTKEGFTAASKTSTAVTGLGVWSETPAPVITGTPTFGNTLTVTTPNLGTWSPTPTSYTYQWKRNGANITAGGTANTYVLTAADVGARISVDVSGVKTNYPSSPQSSEQTDPVAALTFTATPTPTITGNKNVGQTLTAVTGAWSPTPTSYLYQWFRGDTAIGSPTATATYVLGAADLDAQIKVAVTAVRAGYVSPSPAPESAQTTAIARALFTTAQTPTISGAAKVGSTLTAVSTAWVPAVDSYTYQWNRAGVPIDSALARSSTYVIVPDDLGRAITVTVTGTKAGYTDASKISAATAAVAAGTFATPPVPTISGTKVVGDTLTANEGTWPVAPDSFTYVWKRGTTTISGAAGKTYRLQADDRGQSITVLVTGVRAGFTSATSAPSAAFTGVVAPFTEAPRPTITVAGGGVPAVGKVLTAVPGVWSPAPAFTYAWKRGSTVVGTASTYTLVAADLGQPITVTVTGTLATYVTTVKESLATENVIKGTFGTTPTPTITLSAGASAPFATKEITVNPGTWAPVADSLTYQWSVGETPVASVTGKPTVYLVKAADVGKRITATVTAKKAGFDDVVKTVETVAATVGFIASPPTPTISVTSGGTVKAGSTLTAAPGTAPAGATLRGYQWSRATTATGAYTPIAEATASTYVLTGTDTAKFIKVAAIWSKADYSDTAALSAATAAVAAGTFTTTPVPTIVVPAEGVKVGQTLTADEGTWLPSQDSFSYVWKIANTSISPTATSGWTVITGATNRTYDVKPADADKFIMVEVTGIKAGYTSVKKPAASATVAVARLPFTTAPTPTITVSGGGAAAVGQVLTAVPGTWSPAAATPPTVASPTALSYVWKRNGVAISGATASTYPLVVADLGQTITVTVTGTLTGYVTTPKTSEATATVIKGTFGTTPTPTITLSAAATAPFTTKTITATVGGTWAPLQDSFTYQWAVDGALVGTPSATATSYVVKAADLGKKITVTVTAKKNGFNDLSRTSAETVPVTLGFIASPPTPKISVTSGGTVKAGSTLTATPGTAPAGATLKGYQWSRATTATGVYTPIAEATASTYVLTGTDTAKFIKVAAIWSKTDYSDTSALSGATAIVAAGTFSSMATPTIDGSVNVGSTLTANEGVWAPAPDSYTYKWFISTSSTGTYTPIANAIVKTYRVAPGDLNKFIKVEITAVKTGYTTSVAFRSAATAAVGPTLPQ